MRHCPCDWGLIRDRAQMAQAACGGGKAGLADRCRRPHRVQARATDGQRAEVKALRRARPPLWKIATKPGLSRATPGRGDDSC